MTTVAPGPLPRSDRSAHYAGQPTNRDMFRGDNRDIFHAD